MVGAKISKSKISFSKIVLIVFLTLIAVVIRSIPLNFDHQNGDILVHYDWSKTLYTQDLKGIYFYSNWLYTPLTQPPLMTLGFWISRHFYQNRYLLSQLHNSIKIPPAFMILWFDQYGEFLLLRLWAILGDIIAAFIVFFIIQKNKHSFPLAITGFIFMLFNPLSLFESWIWGQNDIISVVFVYLAFTVLNKKNGPLISPILYLIGILIKPTCLVLIPFYIFYFFKNLKLNKTNLIKITLSFLFCLGLIFISFKPFLKDINHPVSEITNIVLNRMTSSSKGVSRASNSGFNFFSLFFELDKTSGSQKILGLTLDSLGKVLLCVINFFAIYFYRQKKYRQSTSDLMFFIFFISQATFLFVTGMLERYFFPAFIASIILLFLDFKTFGKYMIIQNFIWFTNLFYSFFQRQIGWVKLLFEFNNLTVIRIISLISLLNLIFVTKKYFSTKKYSATKSLS